MKIASATLRVFTAVHTWVGLVAGLALFVAFYAGAITVFHHDLQAWQSPHGANAAHGTLADAQRLLDGVLERHAKARDHVGMLFPGHEASQPIAYWQDAAGVWQFATLEDVGGSPTPPQAGLSELVNELHYSLGIPGAGMYLMGLVSLLYGLALVSGVVIHLPRLAKDLFALRPGRNLKRFWQDAHNVVGVLSLPFHVVFAVTGALLCLGFLVMAALNPLVFDGKLMAAVPAAMDTAPVMTKAGVAAPSLPLADLHARAIAAARERGVADFEPAYLKLQHAGDANAAIEITGASHGAIGSLGAVALGATDGRVLAAQLPGSRDVNHGTLATMYALHFGDYGNRAVAWLYFALGLAGAFLFYSGNLLWIEARRKRRQAQQGRAQMFMARLTVGVCLGVCVAISAAFVATALGTAFAWAAGIERVVCFGVWALCVSWAFVRAPAHAARELCLAAAIVTALVPVAHGAASGWWLWRSAAAGDGALFAIDAVAVALACAFASLARATTRRMRDGEANSVWSAAPAVRTLQTTSDASTS